MFCTNCGTNNSTDARYCYKCGTALTHGASKPPELPHASEDSIVTDSIQEHGRKQTRRSNFLVKHWRGDYSLGFSYWVIGSLLTVIVVAITTTIGSNSGLPELGARASGTAILVFYGLVATLTLWQLVGIWRSADKHSQRGGKAFWAGIAKGMVVLGLLRAAGDFTTQGIPLISDGARLLVGIDNTPPHQIRLLRDGIELELAGGMPFGTTDALIKFLDAAPAVQIIHLNSQGGRIYEGYQLYKTIKERNLSTYTSTDCASACSLAFLAGRERYLGEDGRLGFHSTSIGVLGGEVNEAVNDELRQTLQLHGVPNSFIDRALSTSPRDMWYPSNDELLEAKIIDSVVDSRYFGLSGVIQWRDAHAIESELLAFPLYSALAQYDQPNWAKLRNILISGIQKGRAEIEIENDVRSIFRSQLIPTYLIKAPDEELFRYIHSNLAEMKYLEKMSPEHCAYLAFVLPEFAKTAEDLERLLPKNLVQEDLDALASVVKGVATNPQGSALSPQIQTDLEAFQVRFGQKYPELIDIAVSPASYTADPASLCAAGIAMISELLAIPGPDRSSAAFRYLINLQTAKSGTVFLPGGDKYTGELENGTPNGQGTYTLADGDKYTGELKDGNFNGQGTMTSANGSTYTGAWNDDLYNGQGIYTDAIGTTYTGEFKDGSFNGQGTTMWADGTTYTGAWKNDLYNGQGTYTDADGKYTGEFKDGSFNGQGTITLADGRTYTGEFKDGERVP